MITRVIKSNQNKCLNKALKPLIFLASWHIYKMDLRGIEPLSESLFIQASPITVILLKVPPSARRMTGLPLR